MDPQPPPDDTGAPGTRAAPADELFLGAVALELVPGSAAARALLARDAAARCGDGIANDLARLVADSAALDLVLAGALFDPAELLRPGWPVHAALARLAVRAPGESGGRVLAFGTAEARPTGDAAALMPAPSLAGGPLRLLPWLLRGPAGAIGAVGAQLEEHLLERGMAEAATALALQDAFGARLEHVRHLSIHDLCALTAAQYQHAALDGAWHILEAALLHAGSDAYSAADGPPLLWHAGRVWLGTLDFDAWSEAGLAPPDAAAAAVARAHGYWQMRERQLRAVLEAHGLAVAPVALSTLEDAEARLRAAAR